MKTIIRLKFSHLRAAYTTANCLLSIAYAPKISVNWTVSAVTAQLLALSLFANSSHCSCTLYDLYNKWYMIWFDCPDNEKVGNILSETRALE